MSRETFAYECGNPQCNIVRYADGLEPPYGYHGQAREVGFGGGSGIWSFYACSVECVAEAVRACVRDEDGSWR